MKLLIKKILVTTIVMLIILTIYTIPKIELKENVLRTNLELEDITNIKTHGIYLLNSENLLVKTEIFIKDLSISDQIKYIIDYISDSKINLKGYIDKNTKLMEYTLEEGQLIVNVSKEFLLSKDLDIAFLGLSMSLLDIENVDKVLIKVEGKIVENHKNFITENNSINEDYFITSRKDISKVTVFYLDQNNNYIPVTKYLNDNREKIEIIIDELKSSYHSYVSVLNDKVKLLNYHEDNNGMTLSFNDYIINSNQSAQDKIFNVISYSVFSNYNVNMVMFEVNGKQIKYIKNE